MKTRRIAIVSFLNLLRFRLPITLIARTLILRDRILSADARPSFSCFPTAMVAIPVQTRTLTASFHQPRTRPRAAVLIFHGIGERSTSWQTAQHLLAQHGIASLVLAYSGYPGSGGATTPANLHHDTLAAYSSLRSLVAPDTPAFLLGLSLGTGIAIEAAPSLTPPPAGIILCQAFTSLRDAARAILRSRALARLLPDLYPTEATLPRIASPLLIVHADGDRLFPLDMGRRLHASALTNPGRSVHLAIPRGHAHNDAFLRPALTYWQPILDFIHALSAPPPSPR